MLVGRTPSCCLVGQVLEGDVAVSVAFFSVQAQAPLHPRADGVFLEGDAGAVVCGVLVEHADQGERVDLALHVEGSVAHRSVVEIRHRKFEAEVVERDGGVAHAKEIGAPAEPSWCGIWFRLVLAPVVLVANLSDPVGVIYDRVVVIFVVASLIWAGPRSVVRLCVASHQRRVDDSHRRDLGRSAEEEPVRHHRRCQHRKPARAAGAGGGVGSTGRRHRCD
mmetsp:Transcript_97919/g.204233  ORF Transcript_97919/g.204233 Transcript_97919/m.204233 type:complete len:221 (-) Transcript_97919:331-993(-)